MGCKHKWVDMEDGSLDKFCVRCSNKAKQAQLHYKPINTIGEAMSMKEFNQRNNVVVHSCGLTARELGRDISKALEKVVRLSKGEF